jgi:hypothetical protein
MAQAFLIATVNNRIDMLKSLLKSMSDQHVELDWDIIIIAQMYSEIEKINLLNYINTFSQLFFARIKITHLKNGMGANLAKIIGLQLYEYDIYCSLDDDMIFTERFNADPILKKLEDPRVGLVSGNWAKSTNHVFSKTLKDEFIRQPIVYTGGGLFFRKDLAKIFIEKCTEQYLFDNIEWSVNSYVSGYENYRYLGSIIVHLICSVGGRKLWVSQKNRVLPNPNLITLEKCTEVYKGLDNNYHMASSKDLTALAHKLHRENLKG